MRRKLTEPDQLYLGLGFEYLADRRLPPLLGEVVPGGPAAQAPACRRAIEISVAATERRYASFTEFADYVNARPGKR